MPPTAGEPSTRSATASSGVSAAMPSVDVADDAGAPRVVERPDASMPQDAGAKDAGPMRAEPRDAGEPTRDAGQPVRDAAAPPQQPAPDASAPPPLAALCEPGTYSGTFSGQIEAAGAPLSSVTGSVRAQLVWDLTMLYLQITDAQVMGLDQDGNTLTASLSGSINCITGLIEEGRLDSGVFHIAEASTDLTFIGIVEGAYSRDQQTLLGTWSGEADASALIAGRGAFTLVASP